MTVVDAHHHLWVRARHPQPWIDPVTMAAIHADFEVADLTRHTAGLSVTETVVVQCTASVTETIDLLAIAAKGGLVRGVVGWIDLASDDVADQLDRLRSSPGGSRLVGIRHGVQSEPDPWFLDRPDIRRGIQAVGGAGLVFDLLVLAHQLPAATRLVRALPEVSFVLDHLGKPALASGDTTGWKRDLAALAEAPNVTAKLSGLVTEANWSTWTPGDVAPAVYHALDVFGPDRLMFGSDWPVALLAGSYERWVEVLTGLLAGLDSADQSSIWRDTARRVYHLPPSR
ncbi:amidohydrolase family protein [Phytoactinopolyspora limicola]|uniref:amidohydrolase family protein n=1 Tax=Phytoactinopolyspora limicola TaxID=2715536 RepID=UPI001408565D|nr:amidohydrolase family protein [Phytoactinopolyspora limicola]